MQLFERGAVEVLRRAQPLPPTLDVRVMLVDSLDPGMRGFWRMRKLDPHARRHDRVARQCVIHEQRSDARLITRDPRVHSLMQAINQQTFGPKLVQEFERAVRRLGDALQIEETKSAMKRHGWKAVLFKNI